MSNAKNKFLAILLVLLVLTQAGLAFLWLKDNKQRDQEQKLIAENLPVHNSYFSNKDFYEEAYEQAESQKIKSIDHPYGGIIPHHLMVKDKIALYFEGIKEKKYETIVLIGPNHFLKGSNKILLSSAKWLTPYGDLYPDTDLINKIVSADAGKIEEDPFGAEHSISGLVGFIKKSFPDSKLVPIILKPNATEEECDSLAKNIYKYTDPEKTLVLASVDFSHYQPANVADFHDQESNNIIETFDFSRIYNLEIDSPPSIYTVLKYLDYAGAKKSTLIFSTNSGYLINKPEEPTTSHNFFYFQKGDNSIKEKNISFLFFGDLMLDRHVGEKIKQNGIDWPFTKLAGEENRFFQGPDIISANLEGAVANNGAHYNPEMAYDFSFSPEIISNLKKYNFNFFNLANNHFSDQGERGIIETRKNLDELKLNYTGCQDGQIGDCSGKIVEIYPVRNDGVSNGVAGKKIGLAGFSTVYSLIDSEKAGEVVKKLANETDLVIVNFHWGVEYDHEFNQTQQKLARALIDDGADIIIGHHPHVVQGLEIYKNKPIFYSLGNFVFDQYFSSDTQEGLAVGINTANQETELYLFPMKSKLSQPELMKGQEKEKFLNNFISWSDLEESYKEQIKQGKLIIKE